MIRKFRGNNFLKGRILHQMPHLIESKAIQFEKGAKRNTCIIIVDESKIEEYQLYYMYKVLVPVNREI